MLSLAKATKDYYLQKLGEVTPREDYYLQGGTATGVWAGSGAADIGLSGPVSAEGLVRMFDGEHPVTGEQLGVRLRRNGVAAWDVTFSADKSVSLLWAVGDESTRREVLEAFDTATSEAVAHLESVASSTRGARRERTVDDDGVERTRVVTWPIETTGYVAASFTEFTSRADDPQLHTHVVVANKVQGRDGKWRSLDARRLYRYQLAAGYLHEAVLRHELTRRLGVGWQQVRNGVADIAGFDRHQVEAFSQRRRQAEEWREDQGLPETPAARQAAVLATRNPKSDHPLGELEVEWHQRAIEVGLTPERIAQILATGAGLVRVEVDRLTKELCSEEGLTANVSTFGRADAVKAVAASLPTGAPALVVEGMVDEFLTRPEVTELAELAADGERRYTTTELLELERKIVERTQASATLRWRVPAGLARSIPRWTYRGAGSLRGIPDSIIQSEHAAAPLLLVDAKNRFVRANRLSRSEEIYKMLGYAENFRQDDGPRARFHGLLVFPSDRASHRVLDGPDGGRLDLVAVDLSGDRAPTNRALETALS